jgi:hypothetical protein
MIHSLNPTSSEQPSYHEDTNSFHFQGPHSTHLHRDLCLPKIEVNKFDGSNPTHWVIQMEHYLFLYIIDNELEKHRYGILYLDIEWW